MTSTPGFCQHEIALPPANDPLGVGYCPLCLRAEVERLRDAVRLHRDQRGDDRCWLDDETLYAILPEGYTPPTRDTRVELALCEKYIACRHNPGTEYVSPQREIERLREALTWAVGFIRCQKPQTEADYPDMRNAISLVEKSSLYSGEFHQLGIRAELAEEEVRRLQAEVERLREENARLRNHCDECHYQGGCKIKKAIKEFTGSLGDIEHD